MGIYGGMDWDNFTNLSVYMLKLSALSVQQDAPIDVTIKAISN